MWWGWCCSRERRYILGAGGPIATPLIFRELSWLEFNARVLQEARDRLVPLLERVKFISIFSSNLDEFFMVRYAGLWRAIDAGVQHYGPDGESPREILAVVSKRVQELVALQHHVLMSEILPALARQGIHIRKPADLDFEQLRFLEDYFERTLLPVLTPMAVDPGHPFPHLGNRALCVIAELGALEEGPIPAPQHVVVPLPLPLVARFIRVPGGWTFVIQEDIVRWFLPRFFPQCRVRSCHAIRVTRDGELDIQDDAENLLSHVEEAVRKRRKGQAVRLQHEVGLPPHLVEVLREELRLDPEDIFPASGFTALTDMIQLYNQIDLPALKDPVFHGASVPAFDEAADCFAAIRAGDILLHHPYQDFGYVTRFIRAAAEDPTVLAIKMTLYRTSGDSAIAKALQTAARNGKQVAVLVELRARFNEESNIAWARRLEAAGAHVVYGIVGYKTHCKAALVVRQEADGLRRYCHLATGNYNDTTARFYTDFGLFTCQEEFGEDLGKLFNLLTGYARPENLNQILIAPIGMKDAFIAKIRREMDHAREGRPAHIRLKMNALTDPDIIAALYEANAANVPVEAIVRGICALKPAMQGLSEHIRVYSIIDRFLEHARIFCFENGGDREYWLSSADWMSRNLNDRIEVAFPILDPVLQAQIEEALQIQFADTVKARVLLSDSSSVRKVVKGEPVRSQERLIRLAMLRAGKSKIES